MYFIRMEESIEDVRKALERGRSIRRWAFAGCTPWEHLAFAIPAEEQQEALEEYFGRNIDSGEITSLIHDDLFVYSDDKKLASILNLENLEDGGYAEFLDGLCAIDSFDTEPTPDDVEIPSAYQFQYMVCYEGEYVGSDPDEGWDLFKPSKIVWTHETSLTQKRWKEI